MDKLADSGTDDDEMEIDEDESEDDGADIMQWAYVGAVSGCWRTLIKKAWIRYWCVWEISSWFMAYKLICLNLH